MHSIIVEKGGCKLSRVGRRSNDLTWKGFGGKLSGDRRISRQVSTSEAVLELEMEANAYLPPHPGIYIYKHMDDETKDFHYLILVR